MANYFRAASMWLKVALICMGIGFLLFIIGFATPAWKTWDGRTYSADIDRGLWQEKYCPGGRNCRTSSYSALNDFQQAVQAMECIGLIGFFLALLILGLYMFADSARRRDFLKADIIFTFVGALFAGIGFALAASSHKDNRLLGGGDIGWSMGVAIAGTIFYGIAGIMLALQLLGC